MPTTVPQDDPNRDLGLGSRVAQQSRDRFLNRDGSFNHHEVVWNARFADIFEPSDGDRLSIDLRKLHELHTLNRDG